MQDTIEKLQRFLQSCSQDTSSSEYVATSELIQNITDHFLNKKSENSDYSSQYASLRSTLKEKIITTVNNYELKKETIIDENGESKEQYIVAPHHSKYNIPLLFHLAFNDLNQEFKRLDLLQFIQDSDKNAVLLGANGSGKSSLASFLKNSNLENLFVIPAQKYLFLTEDIVYHKRAASYEDIISLQAEQDFKQQPDTNRYVAYFKNIITSITNRHTKEASKHLITNQEINYTESDAGYLCGLFNQLIPNIELRPEGVEQVFIAKNIANGEEYDFNLMSDGERAIVFYIANILIAKQGSIIVIDEPETYLNPTIYKSLWNELIAKRQDCRFVFITHSMDFIASRESDNTYFYWIKEYTPPNNWEIEKLPNIENMPQILVAELMGSKKPILFCEGQYESYDYQIYSALFGAEYTVTPVGGHISVINYTKSFNDLSSIHHNRAIGIIDRDLMDDEREAQFNKDKIYVLPFNEIEMLFLTDIVMDRVISNNFEENETREKIENFKNKFFTKIEFKKDKIITSAVKKEIDNRLEHYKIQDYSSLETIQTEITQLTTKLGNISEIAEPIEGKLQEAIDNRNYDVLLTLCNLKKEVLKGLGDQCLDSEYARRALKQIKDNCELQNQIKELYFSQLIDSQT